MFEIWEQQIFLVVLIAVVFVAFVREWLPVELVAITAFFTCIVAGILPLEIDRSLPAEERERQSQFLAFSVFAHPAPLIVACMFVLSAALERTGVVEALGNWFEQVAATGPIRMLLVLMALVAFLSAFVNNTPVVVVFMPIILGICRRKEWKASRYLIPLSYAAIVGGTVTIVGTSTNVIAAGTWQEHFPDQPFSMFEFALLGLVFTAVTIVYMVTLGRRFLPDRVTLAALIDSESSREFITHGFIREGSPLIGTAYKSSTFAKSRSVRLLEVIRDRKPIAMPMEEVVFAEGDEVIFKGHAHGLADLGAKGEIQVRGKADLGVADLRTESAVLMEGIIGPESSLEGKSLRELNFQQRHGVIILAVHRRGHSLQDRFEEETLTFGDTLLVQGPAEKMNQLFQLKDFINLSRPRGRMLRQGKAPLAVLAVVAFMVVGALMGFGVIPQISVAALAFGAALFVLLSRCIDPREAYQAIEWKVLFLIIGMLGLGKAVASSGLDAVIGDWVAVTLGTGNPYLLIAALYLLAAVLTELISNSAVAALLAPIAIAIGVQAGIDPRPLVAAIMFGASASFVTPIGYQTNTFVYGAGGYRFGDFFRAGFPLALLLWLTATLLIPTIWPPQ